MKLRGLAIVAGNFTFGISQSIYGTKLLRKAVPNFDLTRILVVFHFL